MIYMPGPVQSRDCKLVDYAGIKTTIVGIREGVSSMADFGTIISFIGLLIVTLIDVVLPLDCVGL